MVSCLICFVVASDRVDECRLRVFTASNLFESISAVIHIAAADLPQGANRR